MSREKAEALFHTFLKQQREIGVESTVLAREVSMKETVKKYANLNELQQAVSGCQNCALGSTRTKFVFGEGNPKARLMFIGEAPGRDEDLQGRPFVGRAGQLLTKMIEAMGLSREEVFIGNILKCRPPDNRDPLPDEMATCRSILNEQIRLINPEYICALGRIAAQALLETNTPLGKLRGSFHDWNGRKVVVTYHPAALLRNPNWKRPAWEDLQMLMGELGLEPAKSEK